jgi:ubiquinone/menaquinone biosynthesis C-methylase UbiE
MFSDPKQIIEQCGIQAGMVIADFGSGSGFYTLEVGKALGGTGKVYAIDVQKDLLVRLQGNARKENLTNIDVIWGDIEKPSGTKIADSTVDLVLLCTILFQVEDKKGCINEVKRLLVPGGRALIVDWAESFGGIGPQTKNVFSKDMAEDLFESMGFSKDREIKAGAHHYGFIYKKM